MKYWVLWAEFNGTRVDNPEAASLCRADQVAVVCEGGFQHRFEPDSSLTDVVTVTPYLTLKVQDSGGQTWEIFGRASGCPDSFRRREWGQSDLIDVEYRQPCWLYAGKYEYTQMTGSEIDAVTDRTLADYMARVVDRFSETHRMRYLSECFARLLDVSDMSLREKLVVLGIESE